MLASPKAIELLLVVIPNFKEAQELLKAGNDNQIKSEYYQGIYDMFVAINNSFNNNSI